MTLVAMTLSLGAWAQNVKVSGTVKDNSGEPLIGVYVLVQGTTNGTSTDFDGTYTLDAPANANLVFSLMGMVDQVIPVNNRSVIDVVMAEDAVLLGDVVVTALGIKKERKALGYSVTEMKAEELLKNKQTNVVNSLAGKIAGVNVTQGSGAAGAGFPGPGLPGAGLSPSLGAAPGVYSSPLRRVGDGVALANGTTNM